MLQLPPMPPPALPSPAFRAIRQFQADCGSDLKGRDEKCCRTGSPSFTAPLCFKERTSELRQQQRRSARIQLSLRLCREQGGRDTTGTLPRVGAQARRAPLAPSHDLGTPCLGYVCEGGIRKPLRCFAGPEDLHTRVPAAPLPRALLPSKGFACCQSHPLHRSHSCQDSLRLLTHCQPFEELLRAPDKASFSIP